MDYEYVLLQKMGIKVYNIPPMMSNKGHMLDSWKNKITELNLKVVGKGHKCTVYLNNYDGSLFAACAIPENYEQAVVRCADSSRGYALKLQDPSGRVAWIGIAFVERNDSFDFHASLEDFAKNRDMELNPQKYAAENKPTQDFSLKKGEKISFNVEGGAQNKPKPAGTGDFRLGPPPGSGGFGFPPPPGSGAFGLPPPSGGAPPKFNQPTTQAPQFNQAPTQSTQASTNSFDNFSNFSNFGGSTTTQTQQNNFGFGQASNQGQFDLLGDVNFSGQSNNTNTNNQPKSNQQDFNNFDLI